MPGPLERVEDGDWETLRRNTDTTASLLNPPVPQARVYNSASIGLTSGSVTALTFNSKRWNEGNLHSTSSNQSRLTASITGLWAIGGNIRFQANATGVRYAYIRLNGSTTIALQGIPTAGAALETIVNVNTQYRLAAGDYVELLAFQNSGTSPLNAEAAANYSPEFWMHRVSGYVNQGV